MIYWISTITLCVVLALSAFTYLFHKSTINGIRELGFPDFFRVELAVLKLLAVVLILLPAVPIQCKEWAYAGATLFFITAIVSHTAHKDSYLITVLNVAFILILGLSRYTLPL